MSSDDHIIAQFTTVNSTLTNINESIIGTNRELGEVKGVQKSQWGAIKRIEKQTQSITEHYSSCPAFESLKELKNDFATLKATAPKTTKIDWRQVFTNSNVKLMLLIALVSVLVIAVALGVSVPTRLFTP